MDDNAIVFADTETLGLDPEAPIWEWAAVRRNADGSEEDYRWFVHHTDSRRWTDDMPTQFSDDYFARYDPHSAIHIGDLVCQVLPHVYRGRAHHVGAVPNFDTERLERQCRKYGEKPPWHYHLIDIENIVVGFLAGRGRRLILPPWSSDELSALVGVDPKDFDRHTAMGDVLWEIAQWDAVMNAEPEPTWEIGARDVLTEPFAILQALRHKEIRPDEVRGELRDWWNGFVA